MIGLLQRVAQASVTVRNCVVGQIGSGLLVFVCAERGDSVKEVDALLDKLLSYRIFADHAGKMNRSVRDDAGGLLLVPQFTLAANTNSGTRPSFAPAAAPDVARELFDYFVAQARIKHPEVEVGQFGADMQVSLVNDGPVTFWLQVGSRNQEPHDETKLSAIKR